MKALRSIAIVVTTLALAGAAHTQQRSDADIRAEIQRRVGPVEGVTVAVQEGVATLTGTVPSLAQELNLINMARRTVGVRQVVDRLTVVPSPRRSDEEILRSVREVLSANLGKDEFTAITIRVSDAVVILTGTLPGSYPKQLAFTLTSLVPGVRGIRNEIVVRPPQPRMDAEILADVRARYARNPFISEGQINVSVENGMVTLAGTVSNFLQVEQAESVARFVPGVIDVRNLLFVRG